MVRRQGKRLSPCRAEKCVGASSLPFLEELRSVWPLTARAQQAKATPHVVHLSPVSIPAQANGSVINSETWAISKGKTFISSFEMRRGDELPALAETIVQEGSVDAIVAVSTPAALAAFKASQIIPIIAFTAVDPVTPDWLIVLRALVET